MAENTDSLVRATGVSERISRRLFLMLAGGSALVPSIAWAGSDFPALLDHFILGCDDLDRGIDFVEKHTGVRAAFGGVHPGDVTQVAARLREADVAFKDPQPGSRRRPDGKVLHWKSLTLNDDHHGLLPFFIEWSADSLPKGCRLERFAAIT